MSLKPDQTPIQARWRLSAEVLGYAVCNILPAAQAVGGGVNSLGCFYDVFLPQAIAPEMIELIELEWRRLIKEALDVRYMTMMRENAKAFLEHHHFFIVAEKVLEVSCNLVDLIQIDSFYALCPSLGLETTADSGNAKILEFSMLDENRDGLIYRFMGTTRLDNKDLKTFLRNYRNYLKQKDHRLLGPRLQLFAAAPSAADLGVVWHPKGVRMRRILLDWWDQMEPDAPSISTPPFVASKTEGGALNPFVFQGDNYHARSNLLDQHLSYLSQMGEIQTSFRKIKEAGEVWHHYPESERWGMVCSCQMTRLQSTICSQKNQAVSEMISSLLLIDQMITIFDFTARWVLKAGSSKKDENRAAAKLLESACQERKISYEICSGVPGKSWYAAQLELRVRDPIGREWTVSEIGVLSAGRALKNFQSMAEHAGTPEELQEDLIIWTFSPVVSLERLIALLIEQFEGNLPFWLMPEQARVIVLGTKNREYACEISEKLRDQQVRYTVDWGPEPLAQKICSAEQEKVPYLFIIGERERMNQKVSLREAGKPIQNELVDLTTVLDNINRRK
jgi:threonyl-tRNA synthetase